MGLLTMNDDSKNLKKVAEDLAEIFARPFAPNPSNLKRKARKSQKKQFTGAQARTDDRDRRT